MNSSSSLSPNLQPLTTDPSEIPIELIITDYPDVCVLLSTISCILSICGAIGIFVTYGRLPAIRNVTRKLIICLTVADLLTASGILISAYRYFRLDPAAGEDDRFMDLCKFQSVLTTYSSLVSFFITVFIGIHITNTVIKKDGSTGTTKALVMFNLVSWIIPGVVVGVAYKEGVIGEDRSETAGTGPWCWIDTTAKHRTYWMWLTGKAWEIACYLLTMSIYVLVKYYTYLRHHRVSLNEIHSSLRNEDKNVLYLWFVLYAIRIWGTIRFLIFLANPHISHKHPFMQMFLYLQAFGDPAQAFCNFIVFCVFDNTVRAHWKRRYAALRSRVSCGHYSRLPEEQESEEEEQCAGAGTPTDKLNTVNKQVYKSTVVNENPLNQDGQEVRRATSELDLFT